MAKASRVFIFAFLLLSPVGTATNVKSAAAQETAAAFAPACPHDPSWQYIVDYHDDRSVDDIPDSASAIAAGFSNGNAFYVGNAVLQSLDISEVEICAIASKDSASYDCNAACIPLTAAMAKGGCDISGSGLSPFKKTIAALAGQCSSGSALVEWPAGQPNGPSFGGTRSGVTWACFNLREIANRHWAAWHTQGYGIELAREPRKNNAYHVAYEFGYYNAYCETQGFGSQFTQFASLVDTFHIRVRCTGGPCAVPSYSVTSAPTPAPPAGGAGAGASAVGDPHLQNIYGERFDLMKAGKHILINIPRGMSAESALLRVQADARWLGGQCADMYFQKINVTGSWAEAKQAGGYHYSVSERDIKAPEWVAFGKVELKVVHGRTDSGLLYLNLYVKHLGRAGLAVGGLLGEDDHEDVSVAPESCARRLALVDGSQSERSPSAISVAVASFE